MQSYFAAAQKCDRQFQGAQNLYQTITERTVGHTISLHNGENSSIVIVYDVIQEEHCNGSPAAKRNSHTTNFFSMALL